MTERVTEARAAELFEATKNWGRWGPDDQRGALNLLTRDRVARAAALIRTGDALRIEPAEDQREAAAANVAARSF